MRAPSLIFYIVLILTLWFVNSLVSTAVAIIVAISLSVFWRFQVRSRLLLPQPPQTAVLITGAGSGIGKATSLLFAERGFYVFAGVRKLIPDGERLIAESKGLIHPIVLDVTSPQQITAALALVSDELTQRNLTLYTVLNCAGVMPAIPVEETSLEKIRQTFEVNVFGSLSVSRAFLPLLRVHAARNKSSRAHLAFISSIGGLLSSPMFGVYCASKFAVEGLIDALRYEVKRFGVHVSVFEFGTIESNLGSMLATDAQEVPGESLYANYWRNGARWINSDLRAGAPKASAAALQIYQTILARFPPTRIAFMRPSEYLNLLFQFLPSEVVDLAVGGIFDKLWK